jgi:hypothetical protein
VVVRLDLERHRQGAAEVDDAGVLPWALQNARALRGQSAQERGRVLVAAVLRPEQREDGELEVVRPTLEQLANTVELPVRQTECPMEWLLRDRAQAATVAMAPARLSS